MIYKYILDIKDILIVFGKCMIVSFIYKFNF